MLMNFSPITVQNFNSHKSQDEIDILLEIDRIEGVKHKLSDIERRFLNATLCESELLQS